MTAQLPIIGRKGEQKLLQDVLDSNEAEFVAIYGRRRVGKTFLIRQFFSDQVFLEVTGEKHQAASVQIARFCDAVSKAFLGNVRLPQQRTWNDAFELLANAIEARSEKDPNTPIVVFLDELPWMSTHRSGLIQALDYVWNARLSRLRNVRLIVCGSAATWMLDKLIHAKGGLYNRVTQRIWLQPFTLAETDAYLKSRNVRLNKRQTSLLYMCMGGIPFYLKNVKKDWSVDQAIGKLCFDENGLLAEEFEHLFESL
ncbi:MAG: ATP-binding protein, partial [Deltaproteobacteria bacterium]|nr:ATP-binding protein [Deltaproteobacteria bacterium]